MTKEGLNDQNRNSASTAARSFVIRASSLIRHSSFGLRHLNMVPNLIHFRKTEIAQFLPARFHFVFQLIESCHKFVRSALERAFRVNFAFPRQIDDCEEHVANLVLDSLAL